jgi:hypothetical protein
MGSREKKTVAIMTFHWALGFGGILQTFALSRALKNMGFDARIINYLPKRAKLFHVLLNYFSKDSKVRKTNVEKKGGSLFRALLLFGVKGSRGFFFKGPLSAFTKRHLKLSKTYHSPAALEADPPQADFYICGSDQIWNVEMPFSFEEIYPYFLTFTDAPAKIAYAASMGGKPLGEFSDQARELMASFKAISAREQQAIDECKACGCDKDVSLVVDPTMLLEAEEYLSLFDDKTYDAPYFVTNFLQPRSAATLEVLEGYRRKDGLKWIDLSTDYFSNPDANEFAKGPMNFLRRLRHAECVITDSFHCSVFSLLFEKKLIFMPLEGAMAERNNRIVDLLKSLDLDDHIVKTPEAVSARIESAAIVDWPEVKERIALRRKASLDFLQGALQR